MYVHCGGLRKCGAKEQKGSEFHSVMVGGYVCDEQYTLHSSACNALIASTHPAVPPSTSTGRTHSINCYCYISNYYYSFILNCYYSFIYYSLHAPAGRSQPPTSPMLSMQWHASASASRRLDRTVVAHGQWHKEHTKTDCGRSTRGTSRVGRAHT